jgi:hypothetical protein
MNEIPFFLRSQVIRNFGITLFLPSFLVPAPHIFGANYHFFAGCGAFVGTPIMPSMTLTGDEPASAGFSFGQLSYVLLFCALCWGSWLNNFTIFFRLPLLAVLISVALPWIAFVWVFPLMTDFLPFYFWVAGIALIHVSRFPGRWPKNLGNGTFSDSG